MNTRIMVSSSEREIGDSFTLEGTRKRVKRLRSCLRVKTQFQSVTTRGVVKKERVNMKNVSFKWLEIRRYPIILGDNPSVSNGPPLSIDWGYDPNGSFTLAVDDFELKRENQRGFGTELILQRDDRESMLLNSGVTKRQIADSVRRCRREKRHRHVSRQNQGLDPMNESFEKISTNLKRVFRRQSSYEKQLQAACSKDLSSSRRKLPILLYNDISSPPTYALSA